MQSTNQPHLVKSVLFTSDFNGSWFRDVGLLLVRIYFGVSMASAGLDKFPTSNWFAGQVGGIGFPAPQFFAVLAAGSEFVGGWLVVAGLLTRPAALLIAATMAVASFTIHADVPFFAIHVARMYLWAFLALAAVGAGRISLDYLVWRKQALVWLGVAALAPLALFAGYREFTPPTAQVAEPVSLQDQIETLSLAGDFNDWNLAATPMTQEEINLWSVVISIEQARSD